MLAMFDSLFIVCMTIAFSLPALIPSYTTTIHPMVFPWLLPILQIALTGSIWSTVAVTVERFLSVAWAQPGRR